jgi:hypothetical protein
LSSVLGILAFLHFEFVVLGEHLHASFQIRDPDHLCLEVCHLEVNLLDVGLDPVPGDVVNLVELRDFVHHILLKLVLVEVKGFLSA